MKPTAPELEILKILWLEQPVSAKAIHTFIGAKFNWSYSSTRKTLTRMEEKGIVSSEQRGIKKFYATELKKVEVVADLAQDFAKRVFELDGPLPVAMLADSRLIDQSEIEDLEKLLDELADKE